MKILLALVSFLLVSEAAVLPVEENSPHVIQCQEGNSSFLFNLDNGISNRYIIQSPNFGNGVYNYNSNCDVKFITASNKKKVFADFKSFELEDNYNCNYDFVCMRGVKYCGDWEAGNGYFYKVPPNSSFTVKFVTDYSVERAGFLIDITFDDWNFDYDFPEASSGVGSDSSSIVLSGNPDETYEDICGFENYQDWFTRGYVTDGYYYNNTDNYEWWNHFTNEWSNPGPEPCNDGEPDAGTEPWNGPYDEEPTFVTDNQFNDESTPEFEPGNSFGEESNSAFKRWNIFDARPTPSRFHPGNRFTGASTPGSFNPSSGFTGGSTPGSFNPRRFTGASTPGSFDPSNRFTGGSSPARFGPWNRFTGGSSPASFGPWNRFTGGSSPASFGPWNRFTGGSSPASFGPWNRFTGGSTPGSFDPWNGFIDASTPGEPFNFETTTASNPFNEFSEEPSTPVPE